jgi:hypothetical protein
MINMNKKSTFLYFISILVISINVMVPVKALNSPSGWSMLPLTDSENDIFRYNIEDEPWQGIKGEFRDEIDVKGIFLQNTDLVIEFYSTPTVNDWNHGYTIYIDLNEDKESEYLILTTTGFLYLYRENDSNIWNGTAWSGTLSAFPHSISGNNLTLSNLSGPIPTFASAEIAVTVSYFGELPTVYIDFVPFDPTGGIPSFTWVLTVFSLLTLMGIIFFRERER